MITGAFNTGCRKLLEVQTYGSVTCAIAREPAAWYVSDGYSEMMTERTTYRALYSEATSAAYALASSDILTAS